jgi:hypothetical protein
MKVLGFEVDDATGSSTCGAVRVGKPGDRIGPPHRWSDGLRHCWRVWVTMGEVTIASTYGDTLQEVEADALQRVKAIRAASMTVTTRATFSVDP